MESKDGQTALDLMQPEVMSEEFLEQVLSQRLSAATVAGRGKPALVELWHRLVTPLPQRKYPDTPAGRRWTARQRRHRPPPDSDWTSQSQLQTLSSSQPSTSSSSSRLSGSAATLAPPGGSRLKPPPLVVGEKRIIKLGAKRPSEGSLDGIVIKRRPSAGEARADADAAGGDAATPAANPAPTGRVGAAAGLTPRGGASSQSASSAEKLEDAPAAVPGDAVAEDGTQGADTNGSADDAVASDIKAKLKLQKRKLKRRKPSASEPEAKRTTCEP